MELALEDMSRRTMKTRTESSWEASAALKTDNRAARKELQNRQSVIKSVRHPLLPPKGSIWSLLSSSSILFPKLDWV